MVITNKLVLQLARMEDKDRKQIMEDNPTANFELLVSKCDQLSLDADDKTAEQLDNVKFMAGIYLIKQKTGADTVKLEISNRTG